MSHPAGALDSIQIAGSKFRRLQGFGSAKTLDGAGAVPLRGVGNLLPRYPVSPLSQALSGT